MCAILRFPHPHQKPFPQHQTMQNFKFYLFTHLRSNSRGRQIWGLMRRFSFSVSVMVTSYRIYLKHPPGRSDDSKLTSNLYTLEAINRRVLLFRLAWGDQHEQSEHRWSSEVPMPHVSESPACSLHHFKSRELIRKNFGEPCHKKRLNLKMVKMDSNTEEISNIIHN